LLEAVQATLRADEEGNNLFIYLADLMLLHFLSCLKPVDQIPAHLLTAVVVSIVPL
jgi:hypothetical protein